MPFLLGCFYRVMGSTDAAAHPDNRKLPHDGRMSAVHQSTSMKKLFVTLGWLAKLAVFLLVLGFALKNSQSVSVESYLGYRWQAPLIVLLLAAFLLGALTGLLALLPYLFRLRRRASRRSVVSEPQTIATDIVNT
jgi:uncharacterized integral membrane protein